MESTDSQESSTGLCHGPSNLSPQPHILLLGRSILVLSFHLCLSRLYILFIWFFNEAVSNSDYKHVDLTELMTKEESGVEWILWHYPRIAWRDWRKPGRTSVKLLSWPTFELRTARIQVTNITSWAHLLNASSFQVISYVLPTQTLFEYITYLMRVTYPTHPSHIPAFCSELHWNTI